MVGFVYGFPIGSIDPTEAETKYRAWFIHEGVSIKAPFKVVPETVGQFTGLHDKNGVEIYEGDIDITGIEIKWDEIAASFICVRSGSFVDHLGEISNLLLITGNIHQNPELLTP